MREIKFRAWVRAGTNTGYVMMQDRDLSLVFKLNNRGSFEKHHAEDYILMQYTGLKDKNGVEIYEGDIVRCTTRKKEDKRKLDEDFISEVFWDVDTLLVHDSPKCDSPIGTYDGNNKDLIAPVNPTMEVIGNIYENPESLNN